MIAFKLNSKFDFIYISPVFFKLSKHIINKNLLDFISKEDTIDFFHSIENLERDDNISEKIDFDFIEYSKLGRIIGNLIKSYNKNNEKIYILITQEKYKDNEYYEEKVKELDVLYSLNSIFEEHFDEIDKVIKNIIFLLKEIYNKEQVAIHVIFDENVYKSKHFIRSSRFERVTIRTNGIDRGRIEVFHDDNSIFRQEDYNILKQIGIRLGSFIEKYEYLKKLNILEYAMMQTKDGVAVYSFDQRIEYCNKACLDMHGYDKLEQVEGRISDIFYDDEHNPDTYFNMRKELLQHGYFEGTFYHKKKNGEPFKTYTTTTVLRRKSGAPSGYISIIRDISELEKKKEEIITAKTNYKTVTEAFDGYIYTVDEDRNIVNYNSALEDKINKSKNKKCYDIIFGLNDICSWCEIENIRSGKNILKEIYNEKEDKYYRLINFPFHYNDKVLCTAMLQDITKSQKQHLDLIEQKEKAVEENTKKTFFINNISFDLRTPLSIVIGFLSIVKESIDMDDVNKNRMDIIYQNALFMNDVLDEITDISLIEAGEVIVHEDLIRPSEFLKNIHTLNQSKYSSLKKQIKMQAGVSEQELKRVYIDSGKITKLFNSVIDIILKILKAGFIKYDIKKIHDHKMIFAFEFSGEMLSQTCIEDVFGNLFKKDINFIEINDENCVAGVDTILARSIIQLLNIKTSFENQGGNISVVFEIPVKEYEEKIEIEKKDIQIHSGAIILLAEDNDANYRIMDYILKKSGCKVIRVSNGVEAVEIFEEKSDEIDIILMDISMDIMNGFEAAEKIKKIQNEKKIFIPIIANTAFGMLNDKKKCLESGCDDYISKPIKKEILLEKISYWLKQENNNDQNS